MSTRPPKSSKPKVKTQTSYVKPKMSKAEEAVTSKGYVPNRQVELRGKRAITDPSKDSPRY